MIFYLKLISRGCLERKLIDSLIIWSFSCFFKLFFGGGILDVSHSKSMRIGMFAPDSPINTPNSKITLSETGANRMLKLNLSPAGSDICSGPIYRHGGFANSIVDSVRFCIQQVHLHTQWSGWPLARRYVYEHDILRLSNPILFIYHTYHRTQTLGHLPYYCVIRLSMDYFETVWKVLPYYYSYKMTSGKSLMPMACHNIGGK